MRAKISRRKRLRISGMEWIGEKPPGPLKGEMQSGGGLVEIDDWEVKKERWRLGQSKNCTSLHPKYEI